MWGKNHMENDAKEKVSNLWNITTIMFKGVWKSFLQYSYFPFELWFFVTTCFVFLNPQKTSRTLWIAFTTGHSLFKLLTYHVFIVFCSYCFWIIHMFHASKDKLFYHKHQSHVYIWQNFSHFEPFKNLAQNLNLKKAPWPHRWVMVAQPSCSHGCVCRQASNMSRWAEPPRRRRTQAPWCHPGR